MSGLETSGPVRLRRNVLLAPYTTWGIGGPADLLAEPATVDELVALAAHARELGAPFTLLGRGSNTLVDDEGIRGIVALLRRGPAAVVVDAEGRVRAEAGCPLPRVAVAAERSGLAGLDFLAGIPGTVGAGVAINAGLGGSGGRSIAAVLADATVLDPRSGEVRTVPAEELGLSYRASRIPAAGLWVLAATFRPDGTAPREELQARRRDLLRKRAAKQPLQSHTSGSVFKEADGTAAGWYIDQCGLKGAREGGAVVSERHANWIENDGEATAAQVRVLMDRIVAAVEARFGIRLVREVRFLPEDLYAAYGDLPGDLA